MSTPKFIVIEGLEGAGKSTALKAVESYLSEKGISSVVTCREPGGTLMGEAIRSIVKDNTIDEKIDSRTELLLMYASRIQLVENIIKPALAEGKWVICDRFYYSTFAYQGGGREIDLGIIQNIHGASIGEFKPDLTVYMDIDPKLGLARAAGRGELDRFELEKVEFFERTRDMYLKLVEDSSEMKPVDASQTIDNVRAQVLQVLDEGALF
ncbi:MAG: dTMP kinase [Lentisphaeraceae bacterium]|nr:dTMP kinase [Lentisphaeraceae bacterium]